jgi:hypothetical protein
MHASKVINLSLLTQAAGWQLTRRGVVKETHNETGFSEWLK